MQIQITAQGGVPIYLQVMQQIKYLVASGKLRAGDELPSIRALAEELIVNPNTIARKERLKVLKQRIDQVLVEAFQMGFGLDEVLKLFHQSDLNQPTTKKGESSHE